MAVWPFSGPLDLEVASFVTGWGLKQVPALDKPKPTELANIQILTYPF